MNIHDAMAEVLKREGVEYLFCYPVNQLIETAAARGIRPIVCRQERVGVGMADAYARVTNGRRIGVFAMQAGPGAENAFPGVSTAFSDGTPLLLMPGGYPRGYDGWPKVFNAADSLDGVAKWTERVSVAAEVPAALRRAVSRVKSGKPGPVVFEVAGDVAAEDIDDALLDAQPLPAARSQADPRDVERAARALTSAAAPVIQAGQGVLYAEATDELVELAELLQAPVYTTLLGKSAFPETHPLALGTSNASAFPRTIPHFVAKADVLLGAGTSLSRHAMKYPLPAGKTIVQLTNDEQDLNKHYRVDYPVVGDAKLVLRQLIDAVRDALGGKSRDGGGHLAEEIKQVHAEWLREWLPKLESDETPINPYRIVHELNRTLDPAQTIMTHDAGSPRDPDHPLLPLRRAALLPRLGFLPRPRQRPRLRYGRQTRRPRQDLRQLYGRRRHRHGRHGLRDRRPRAHPHHHHRLQELQYGHRDRAPRRLPRPLQHPRRRRRLRRPSPRTRRPRRARRRPRRGSPRHSPRPTRNPRRRPPRPPRVHHLPGARLPPRLTPLRSP